MSSTSPEPAALDPDGVDPLVGPGTPLAELDERTAVAAADLYGRVETPRWVEWLGSSGRLDGPWTPESGERALIDLWEVVLRAVERNEIAGCEWAEVAASPPVPLWLRLGPGWAGLLGVEGSRIAAATLAGACAWMEHHWGGSWVAVPGAGQAHAEVVFRSPTGLGFKDHQLPTTVLQAVRGNVPGIDSPRRLLEFVERHGPGTAAPVEPEPDEVVTLSERPGDAWPWALEFDDTTAHLESDRVERLVERLAASPGIERCIHEDRELVLFASDLDRDSLLERVHWLWATI